MGNFNFVDQCISRAFCHLGGTISRHPFLFIFFPLLLSGMMARIAFPVETVMDAEYLFTPLNGPSKSERSLVERLFPINYSVNFDLSRSTRFGRYAKVIVTARDGGSVLRESIFKEMSDLNSLIHSITVKDEQGVEWTYQEICAKNNKRCFENSVLTLSKDMGKIESGDRRIKYPISVDPTTFAVESYGMSLGGVETRSEDGTVLSAKAILLHYVLDPAYASLVDPWEEEFLHQVGNSTYDYIEVSRYASSTLMKEMRQNAVIGKPYFAVMIGVMLSFAVVSCLASDWVRSKPLLGAAGCVSCLLGVGTGMSLCLLAGVEFISSNMSIPFLLLGIGMDDTFVLLAAWRRTDPSRPVSERLSATFEHAGVSITITSLTNLLSFVVGATGPFTSMYIYCTYTAVSVLFVFLFQITFFGGCMALLGKAEERNLHALTFRQVTPAYEARNRNIFFRIFCTSNQTDVNVKHLHDHAGMRFFRDKIGSLMGKTYFKILVIVIFLAYLAGAIYGCSQIKEGLETENLFATDSYAVEYFKHLRGQFSAYPYRIQIVINRPLDYSDPKEQSKIEAMMKDFESTPYTAGAALSESWLRASLKMMAHPRARLWNRGFNLTNQLDFIRWVRFVFFKYPPAKRFKNDIVFDRNFSRIVATRYVVQTRNIQHSNDAKNMALTLRYIANQHGATVFNTYFVYHDQLIVILELAMQAIGVTALTMLAVTLLFLPHPNCVIWVALSIVSIEAGVMGYMTLWNVALNSVSLLGLIMCIGFSVDNAAHVTYAYLTAKSPDPNERVKEALHYVGMPIVQGSLSTILGIVSLSVAPSYVFTTVFKTWFLVMIFSALHSLFLLPVLLSVFGSCCRKKPKSSKDGLQFFASTDSNDNRIVNEETKENGILLLHHNEKVLHHNGKVNPHTKA